MFDIIVKKIDKLYVDERLGGEERSRTGSFYTPYDVALRIARTSLDIAIGSMGIVDADGLSSVRMGDISSGSGIFAIAWLNAIYDHDLFRESIHSSDVEAEMGFLGRCASNMVLIDIDDRPLESFERFVSEEMAWMAGRVSLICGNPLTDGLYESFVRERGRLHVVLGNPPYIGEKGNLKVFQAIRDESIYRERYSARMDYFYFFIFRGVELLEDNGVLGYIVSNYFITADGGAKLRLFLRDEVKVERIVDHTSSTLFKSARGHHSMEVYVSRRTDTSSRVSIEIIRKGMSDSFDICQRDLLDDNSYMSLVSEEDARLVRRIGEKASFRLSDGFSVNQGLVSGLDSCRETGQGAFVVSLDEMAEKGLEADLLKPFYKNSDIGHFSVSDSTNLRIIYIDGSVADEDAFGRTYPNVYSHLSMFRGTLEKRRETVNGIRPWFALHWPRDPAIFTGRAIVSPHKARRNRFAIADGDFYASADVYFIKPKSEEWSGAIEGLCALLNSRLYYYMLRRKGKMKGDLLELYSTPLKNLMIPHPTEIEGMGLNHDMDGNDFKIFEYFALDEREREIVKGVEL